MESFTVLMKKYFVLSVLYGEILTVELSEAFFFKLFVHPFTAAHC